MTGVQAKLGPIGVCGLGRCYKSAGDLTPPLGSGKIPAAKPHTCQYELQPLVVTLRSLQADDCIVCSLVKLKYWEVRRCRPTTFCQRQYKIVRIQLKRSRLEVHCTFCLHRDDDMMCDCLPRTEASCVCMLKRLKCVNIKTHFLIAEISRLGIVRWPEKARKYWSQLVKVLSGAPCTFSM
jgi:hypothetical protein